MKGGTPAPVLKEGEKMKAVLMSLKPEWCKLIADGKKTIEVRKSKPKLKTPFKVYIYCTKDGDTNGYQIFVKPKNANQFKGICTGTVIGEFVCDHIKKVVTYTPGGIEMIDKVATLEACLTIAEISKYAHGKDVFAWYITDLVIYDKPKELSEFHILDKEKQKACAHRERYYTNPDWTNSAELPAGFTCDIGTEMDFCRPFENKRCICLKPLSRPPQSWCYVEEVSG